MSRRNEIGSSGRYDHLLKAAGLLLENVRQCADVLGRAEDLRDPDNALHFLPALADLAEALQEAGGLASVLAAPEVVQATGMGATMLGVLEQARVTLPERARALREGEQVLRGLAAQEQALLDQGEERRRLQGRVQELRRAAVLEEDVADLKEQAERLEARAAYLEQALAAEGQVESAARRLLTLGEQAVHRLRAEARDLLIRAADAEQELSGTLAETEQARRRYAEAEHALEERLPQLRLYQQADRAVAQGFDEVVGVREMVDKVERQLDAADEALRLALVAREGDVEREYKWRPI